MVGRLTLSWANKDKALLSHGESGYEWVDRDDPRVNEVRLLEDVSLAGDAAGTPGDNLLIRGDSLDALRAIVRTPEYAAEYRGKVKLVYIDPPFNTGQAFEHYDDSLEHSVWLGMMRERLELIRELLAPDGSVWVHLDDAEMAYCKVLMDEIFGRANFVASVVWEKTDSPRMDAQRFSSAHDTLLVFAGSESWTPNRYDVEPTAAHFPLVDGQGRRYSRRELRKWGSNSLRSDRPSMWYAITNPDGESVWPVRPDGRDGYWRWKETQYLAKTDQIDWVRKDDVLQPYVKSYAEDGKKPLPPKTVWPISIIGGNPVGREEIKMLFPGVEPFSTPKPERLLERVIHIGSNPGDIVLDCFAGSGTTAAVAHKMARRWVTVELSDSTTATFTRPRLNKVVGGEDPGGSTASAGWTGGGGFRELRIATPTFVPLPPEYGTGTVVAANLAAGQLQRSVAAQLDYSLLDDRSGVFTGTRGRSRLAVIDGVADEIVVGDVLAALATGQAAVVAATAFTPGAGSLLRETSPGSRCVRIPSDLFASGRVIR